ncbi:MAG: FAD-binding protein [Ferruginibacter sp.]
MQTSLTLQLAPSAAAGNETIIAAIAAHTGNPVSAITGFHLLRKSIDARSRQVRINLTLRAFINEPFQQRTLLPFDFKDVSRASRSVVIIGAGPAGLFAALQLIEAGIRPILLERGKDVRSRRRDLALLNREGIVNEDSNYCFGEGGAGTYSDGKLYTRSTKRGNIDRILNLFVHFGADEKILYEAHPHIGTNKLPHIISAMREQIIACGGSFLFEKKLTRFIISGKKISGAVTADGDSFSADAFILATGHSARDIFELLQQQQIRIEAKPFALGVRIEHPQELIDRIQYSIHQTAGSGCARPDSLPPASYSLVQQVNQRGVFSFCMCPGGIIAPAATSPGELVVNGWSPSKRNNPFANSGMVVQVEMKDAFETLQKAGKTESGSLEKDPLLFMRFQQWVEQQCYVAGGGKFVAPAQRMTDFSLGKLSATLPACSYVRGLQAVELQQVLPGFVYHSLAKGFQAFGKKMKGYFTNEAVVVATESRTSSPVRIPRDAVSLAHPQLENLYPCGEGAGYAGGIVSAAMDGERIARQLACLLTGSTAHK